MVEGLDFHAVVSLFSQVAASVLLLFAFSHINPTTKEPKQAILRTTPPPAAMSTRFAFPFRHANHNHHAPPVAMNARPPKDWSAITSVDADQHCLVSRKLSDLGGPDQGLRSILNFFQSACESTYFSDKCGQLGLREGVFVPVKLTAMHPCYEKFAASLQTLPRDAELGLVFHGTAEQNIDAIACDGLDSKKRSGQAHGPGEYFAKNPQISVGYCKGGTEMFVFLVVVPKRVAAAVATRAARVPANFVVVQNNSHQIPLGTMFFDSVDKGVLEASQKLRGKLNQLAKDAEAKVLEVEETKLKAAIMQELMKNEFEKASKLYLENKEVLTELSKREIAWYAQPILKDDPRYATFFPDLPLALKAMELKDANITSLDMAERMECRAKRNLERTHKLLEKKQEQEQKKLAEEKATLGTDGDSDDEKEVVATKRAPTVPRNVLGSILHNMTCNRMDIASELYMEKGHILDGFAKREIAACVRRNMEEPEMIPFLFPNLPDPDAATTPPLKKKGKPSP